MLIGLLAAIRFAAEGEITSDAFLIVFDSHSYAIIFAILGYV